MPGRARYQKGNIFRSGGYWYGRWRRDELVKGDDGEMRVERKQHCEKLAEFCDRYRNKRAVQPLLDAKLKPLNDNTCSAESTLSIVDYGEKYFLPYAERECKPSTFNGYRWAWKLYLKPRLTNIKLLDCRCSHVETLLLRLHEDHHLNRKTLRHAKALLSVIFTHAIRSGVLDCGNPVQHARIPRAAEPPKATHAYTPQEVLGLLEAVSGTARTAIALMYFCGVRPGEARAARWENYDPKRRTLQITQSMWRSHVTDPKTDDSVAPVPVCLTLSEILEETRKTSGFILSSPTGKPVDLQNLSSRIVRPALEKCATCRMSKEKHLADHDFAAFPQWRGWYALRRGCATFATSVETPMAAKSLLRHSNIATTQQHYIKSIPEEALRASEKMDALFQKTAANVTPF